MSIKLTIAISMLLIAGTATRSAAQSHFTFAARTGTSATIGIPAAANPTIGGIPLSGGDEIGAFSPAGLCVGACVWTGTATTITVWGDDPMTPAIDGMTGGQHISYRIWDASSAFEYPSVTAGYSLGDGIYQPNGVYVVSALSADAPLPVELMFFKAAAVSRNAVLKWATATEVNNLGFEIERLDAAKGQWQKIGFVEGAGTTNAQMEYSFTDRHLPSEKVMYRLKQIDQNGRFVYSAAVEVAVHHLPGTYGLEQNFPNPFNPSTTIAFDLPRESFVRLDVFDVLGLHVACLVNETCAAGRHSAVFDASRLSSGIYFYRLDAGAFTQVKRMMLVR